jgi:uncharacterized surface protein with fasciclin (FAS1) repeats
MTGRSTRTFAAMWVAVALAACGGGEGGAGASPGEADVVDASSSPSPLRTFDADTFPDDTIPDLLATDGRFVTFLRILDIHDPSLLSFLTISHETGTVFAPTNDAFAVLPGDEVDALLDRRNTFQVRDLIAGHVLPYVLRSRDFETGPLPMGDDGHPIHQVSVEGGVVVIDGAEVVGALEAVNGIAYVVDRILGLDRIELEAAS